MGFDIRYIKLHFYTKMKEDTVVPRNKASALRGGMGEMLLRMHCIRDRSCEICDFESECLVRRTMYSKMEIQPAFMSQGDSVGYVIECEDETEQYEAGDELRFNLILFGKTIVYFSQFLQAFHQLGVHGLGKNKARFLIERITNTLGNDVLDGQNIYMKNVEVMRLSDYVAYRTERIMKGGGADRLRLVLHSPLCLKYRGNMMETFDSHAILEAGARRVFVMNCFDGIEAEQLTIEGHVPYIVKQETRKTSIKRYSSTHGEKIRLNGFYGHADLERIDKTALDILLAGELLHIGKNTSFGFGRYSLI